jgi:hypothetical protein
MRSCYTAFMRANPDTGEGFWVDWSQAAPGSAFMPFPTVFSSSNWCSTEEAYNTSVGELTYTRQYRPKLALIPPGRRPCGTQSQFQGYAFAGPARGRGDLGLGGFAITDDAHASPPVNQFGDLLCCGKGRNNKGIGLDGTGTGSVGSLLGIGLKWGVRSMAGLVFPLAQVEAITNPIYQNDWYPQGGPFPVVCQIDLYQVDASGMDFSTLLSFFTGNQANFPGYLTQLLQYNGSPAPAATVNGNAITLTYPPALCVATGSPSPSPQKIWGYFVSNQYGDFLWWQQFGAPFVIANAGDFVQFNPVVTIFGQNQAG